MSRSESESGSESSSSSPSSHEEAEDSNTKSPAQQEEHAESSDQEDSDDEDFQLAVNQDADEPEEGEISSEEEDDDEEEEKPKKSSKRSGKIDNETLQLLKEEKILRQSSRTRKTVTIEREQYAVSDRKRKRGSTSESSQESSDSEYSTRRKKTSKKSTSSRRDASSKRASGVNYRDASSDSEIDEEDVLEWEEEDNTRQSASLAADSNAETVERVLKHRDGVPGATGSPTTWYNVQDRGDPNARVQDLPAQQQERQYLVKWIGWSHMHNTWESEKSLRAMGAKGLKKIENYVKRLEEVDTWRSTADKEYIEFYDCEQEMSEELMDQYKEVERIIAHQVSRDKSETGDKTTEYLVKWNCLPYSECTWEDEGLILRTSSKKIEEYFERVNAKTTPVVKHPAFRKRPKFQKLEGMPDFLRQRDNPDAELRDYQLDGLNWLLSAWSKGNSCILADEMGLGKTIQTISFLSSLFHVHELYGPFLVVVPLSTMAAWQREFEGWAPKINVITYMGDVVSREQIRQYELYAHGSKKLKANAVITTYEILLKDKAFLGTFDWAVLAVDEAHRLKNDDSLLYQCLFGFSTNHRLLITGTPLQNSLKELWALLHFIMPEKFDSWPEFEIAYKDRDHKNIAALHRKLEPFLLRRVKKDVEKSLPAKLEQILRVDMTAQQKQYYKWILTKNYQELSKGFKGSINGFVNLVMELKKCCNHCSLVRQSDEISEGAQARLQQLLKSSGKLILLDKLLCRLKETGHRVLIFSQMVMMLDILQEYMQLRRFNMQRLDGSMRSDLRKQALDHFNAPDSADFCFLLSTRAGGLGINLATADTVIIFDSDWNPQNDLQAMSRAHRIGQKKQVNIYRLVTKGSVEEEIVERAKKKLVLDHLVIQRMDTSGKTVLSKNAMTSSRVPFDKNDLNAILKFGAEELFREKEGEEQEPEVDIDDILLRAETRECENHDEGNDLLNSFKYANFAIDEEKDLAMVANHDAEADGKEWDQIIPTEQIEKIKEEERRKAEDELNLGPRQRTKVQATNGTVVVEEADGGVIIKSKKRRQKKGKRKGDSDSEAGTSDSDSGDEGRAGKRGGAKKKVLFSFTEKEVKSFIKSFRKFAHPLQRLDAIAQDAELEEHSSQEISELVQEFLRRCEEAAVQYEADKKNEENQKDENGKKKQDRGPSFKIENIDVYVRPILKQQADLEPLHASMPENKFDCNEFKLPAHPKPQVDWDVEWDEEDDCSLLRGIYRYGHGSWEAIKMDPEFGLADKISLKDKVKKPQPKHLHSRTEYLLRFLAKCDKKGGKTKGKAKLKKTPVFVTSPLPKDKASKRPLDKRKRKHDESGENAPKGKTLKRDVLGVNAKRPLKPLKVHKPSMTNGASTSQKSTHSSSPTKEHTSSTSSKDRKKEMRKNVLAMKVHKEKYGVELEQRDGPIFAKCVEMLKPISKYLKKLVACGDPTSAEGIKYLTKLGDHITDQILAVASEKDGDRQLERWHSYLWVFLSQFITPEQDPVVLSETYKQCVKQRQQEEKAHKNHHHHHHHEPSSKDHHHEPSVKDRVQEERTHKDHHYHPHDPRARDRVVHRSK